jgi:hypothetical protein
MRNFYPDQERRNSVKDILNLGFTAHLESKVSLYHLVLLPPTMLAQTAPDLPKTQEEAMRFQEENLAAASRMASRVGSLAPSRCGSLLSSRVQSRVGSRMGSRSTVLFPWSGRSSMLLRTNSMNNLHNIDGELPETLDAIKNVTETQDAVMSFYYTDSENQVATKHNSDPMRLTPSHR